MDNRYYENVINEMLPFFEENGFALCEDGSYKNEKKSVKISYDEPRQMYALSVADIEDGVIGEYVEVNAWLFDDTQNAKDATAVGIDFTNSLRSELGIKAKRIVTDVELPSASKGSMNINGFAKKVLDLFPVYKDAYKEHVATYGNFLFLSFFGETLVPQVKSVLKEGNKKQVKKLADLFENAYIEGDRNTVNTVVAVLCAAAYNDGDLALKVKEMLGENKHFISSVESFAPVFAKKKKLLSLLVK